MSLSLPERRVSEALEHVDRAGRSRVVALVAAGEGPAADAAADDAEVHGLVLPHHSQTSQPAEIQRNAIR